jgi:hypothetical protein
MKSAFASTCIAAALCVALPSAHADRGLNAQLQGDYVFSGEAICYVSDAGFTPDLKPKSFPYVVSFSIEGIRTFNGDGTGTFKARALNTRHPRALPTPQGVSFEAGGISATDIQGNFTYEVNADGTVSVSNQTLGGVEAFPPAPPGAPSADTVRITNLPDVFGAISGDHKTISVAHLDPAVETHTHQHWNGTAFETRVEQRVCHRTRVMLRMKD